MNILWGENYKGSAQVAVKNFLTAHEVTVVPSLAAARVCLSKAQYDIIMLDYDLDDGKSSEMAEEVLNKTPRLPIIATSSHVAGNQGLLEAGVNAVCSKMSFAGIEQVIGGLVV